MRKAAADALGLNEATVQRPDAVILDLGLLDADRLDVLSRLREWSGLPVLILSVRGDQTHYPRVYMTHLRQKLKPDPSRPSYLKTDSAVGYRFTAE